MTGIKLHGWLICDSKLRFVFKLHLQMLTKSHSRILAVNFKVQNTVASRIPQRVGMDKVRLKASHCAELTSTLIQISNALAYLYGPLPVLLTCFT